jgi:hypothetical protein
MSDLAKNQMKTVVVPSFWVDEVTVQIDLNGTVFLDGQVIGKVAKGHRTYSPPISKGSRIVRYHKKVSEWHGWKPDTPLYRRPDYQQDTRQRVLQALVRDAVQKNG